MGSVKSFLCFCGNLEVLSLKALETYMRSGAIKKPANIICGTRVMGKNSTAILGSSTVEPITMANAVLDIAKVYRVMKYKPKSRLSAIIK